jgi:structural maintenance of chromosome 1
VTVTKELEHVRGEIASLEKEISEMTENLEETTAEVNDLKDQIQHVEDKAFSSFCKKAKVVNIREFDEGQGALTSEYEQRKLEFDTNKAKFVNEYVLNYVLYLSNFF